MNYTLIINKEAEEEIVVIAHSPSSLTQEIETLVRNFSGADFVMGTREEETRKLAFDEIECITIIDRKVVAIDRDAKQYSIKHNLRDLEDILPSYFIRINKSALANEHRILRFNTVFSGGVDAVFYCGYKEYVSRRCFSEIKRRYEGV